VARVKGRKAHIAFPGKGHAYCGLNRTAEQYELDADEPSCKDCQRWMGRWLVKDTRPLPTDSPVPIKEWEPVVRKLQKKNQAFDLQAETIARWIGGTVVSK